MVNKNALDNINGDIDIRYVSPFPRTIQTAHYFYEKFQNMCVVIESRIMKMYFVNKDIDLTDIKIQINYQEIEGFYE